ILQFRRRGAWSTPLLRCPSWQRRCWPFQGLGGTSPLSINAAGAVTGSYADVNDVKHGFLGSPEGSLTLFDAPGAGTKDGCGTVPLSIHPASAITGFYTDASFMSHGFLRSPGGILTTFNAPGATSNVGTSPTSINPAGTITGSYSDAI